VLAEFIELLHRSAREVFKKKSSKQHALKIKKIAQKGKTNGQKRL